MKITYFLRGLGIGIIFCALVLFFAYKTTPTQMTDEEVVRRAKELGMVEAGESDSQLDDLFADENKKAADGTTEESGKKKASKDTSATTEEPTKATTTETATTEAVTTEVVTTEAATTEESKAQTVSFTIESGMYSEKVASTLAYLGVISNAKEFNQYLNDHGYASRLVTGTYKVTKGEDYYSIAEKITSSH